MVVIGQIVGALCGGVLANAIGRKKSMVLIVVGYAVFALLGAVSVSMPMLLVARLLLGLTIGVSVVVVPVYVAESAPAAVRGSLLTAYQVATVSGIILGYLVGYLLAGTHSWRWMLGLAAVPATLLLPILLRMPDTARWYLLKGRVDDARRALLRVEPDAATVDAELAEIARALSEGSGGVSEMLRRPYLRATIFVITLGFLVQITGINAIIYYSPRIFEAMGFKGYFAMLALPALVQVAGLAAVCTSLLLVDRLGRRPILLSGIAMMIAADAVLIAVFAEVSAVPRWYSASPACCCSSSASASGSARWYGYTPVRASRLACGQWGRALCSPPPWWPTRSSPPVFLTMLHSLGGAGAFAVFGVFAVIAFAVVYRYAPETKGRQLEDIRHFWENGGRWPTPPRTGAHDRSRSADGRRNRRATRGVAPVAGRGRRPHHRSGSPDRGCRTTIRALCCPRQQ